MNKVSAISTAVMLASMTAVVSLLTRDPVPRAVRPGPVEEVAIKVCGPLESLKDLRQEIIKAFEEDYLIRQGTAGSDQEYINKIENPASIRVRGLVIRARDCHGVESAADIGVSEEFWKNTTGTPNGVSKREKP